MTLGEKIQELRRRSGMSQDTLAEVLDVSRQAVSKWERDEAVPETDKIVRIAKVFSVSTDHLLLEETPQPAAAPIPQPHNSGSSVGDRLERFVRRHGYKAGYVMMAVGAFVCIIGLLVMCLVPGFASGIFDSFRGTTDSMGGVMNNNGFGGIPGFGDMQNAFDQQVDQMENVWTSSTTIIALIFAIPATLAGVALVVLGIVIVVKGKRFARETN